MIVYKPRSVGWSTWPSVAWDDDGASGDPIVDLEWLYSECVRHIQGPELIVVKGVGGMRELAWRLAEAAEESFVSVARRIKPAELRRAVIRAELERQRRESETNDGEGN